VEALAIVLGLLVVLLGGAAVLAGLVVVKTKRALGRAAPQARRAAEDVAIKARSLTRGGAHGEVARLRAEVRSALAASRRVLASGAAEDTQLTESLGLLGRLDGHADELDGELRLLEREPDPARVQARLAVARERAERIVHMASSLRWAAQDRMHRFADDDLALLGEECEAEAGALRHWTPAAEVLPSHDAAPGLEGARGLDGARERIGALSDRLRKPRPGAPAG
jgi:hypothetical protein